MPKASHQALRCRRGGLDSSVKFTVSTRDNIIVVCVARDLVGSVGDDGLVTPALTRIAPHESKDGQGLRAARIVAKSAAVEPAAACWRWSLRRAGSRAASVTAPSSEPGW